MCYQSTVQGLIVLISNLLLFTLLSHGPGMNIFLHQFITILMDHFPVKIFLIHNSTPELVYIKWTMTQYIQPVLALQRPFRSINPLRSHILLRIFWVLCLIKNRPALNSHAPDPHHTHPQKQKLAKAYM